MSRRSLTLSIPQPCSENWAAMTPAGQGRHCAACDKVVVDFTRMTDAEVVAWLKKQSGHSCGRVRADQVARPLLLPETPARWRRWLTATMVVLGLGELAVEKAQAQQPTIYVGESTIVEKSETEPTPRRHRSGKNARINSTGDIIIKGRVVDFESKEGLPGTTVRIVGTQLWTSTEKDGTFLLTMPASQRAGKNKIRLGYSFIGFKSFEQRIKLTDTLIIAPKAKLQHEVLFLGGMAFHYAPSRNPLVGLISQVRHKWLRSIS